MKSQMTKAMGAAALALWMGLAQGQDLGSQVDYSTGGVGHEEREQMMRERSQYNLWLTFANERDGAYRSDVDVRILDARGQALVDASDAGPWLYAKLNPGTYRVEATARGQTITRSVRVGKGATAAVLRWPAWGDRR